MHKESKEELQVLLFVLTIMALPYLMYFIYFIYVWDFDYYNHIKNVYLQGKTYSLLYKKKDCKKQCYYIAVCLGNAVDEGCPVNEALMDYAEFMFKADKIYNISVKGNTLLISSSRDIKSFWGLSVESIDDNHILYKSTYRRENSYSGNYFILIEYVNNMFGKKLNNTNMCYKNSF